MAGETEESLKRQGVDYVVGRGPYQATARGRIIGDTDGFLKLLFRRHDMKLLGVHAIGEQATELVHIGMIAMLTGSAAALFDEACFNLPTLGELYRLATLDALSRLRNGRSLFEPVERPDSTLMQSPRDPAANGGTKSIEALHLRQNLPACVG